MRALTVRQPWAWAIMRGQKGIENRTRNIVGSYRGDIAITSALTFDPNSSQRFYKYAKSIGGSMPMGVVLGVVHLSDVHRSFGGRCVEPVTFETLFHFCSNWAEPMDDGWHIELHSPRPLKTPIPVRGRLGLWTLPDDIAAQVEEALR